ncbi:MAG: hypothetical protein CSB34_03005 [Desulfobulbus propionicus]|nr:MAG: hypothetical protein CSB34_03005 [Desulfobulbus propionicus]
MNKRIVTILVVVMLAAGAGVYGMKFFRSGEQVSYAAYLPQDTIATISLTHLKELKATFATSPLGKFLAKDTMAAILDELQAQPETITNYNKAYDDVAEVMHNPAFLSVFGDDTSLGILPPNVAALDATPEEEVKRSLVVFATTAASGALESFAKLVVSDSVSTEQVEGKKLTKIRVDEQVTIYGVADSGTVLLSYNPQTLVRCLQIKESGQTLATTSAFQAAEAFWQKGQAGTVYSRSFVNPVSLQKLFEGAEATEAKDIAAYLNGFTFIASLSFAQGDTLYSDSKAGFVKEQLHEWIKAAIDDQVDANNTLHLLTESSLLYDWSSALSPEMMLSSFKAGDAKQAEELDLMMQQNLGVSLEELFSAIGPQYGFLIQDIVNTGVFPVPKMVAFVEARDRQKMHMIFDALRKQINHSGFTQEQQLDAGGQTVYYWSLLPGEATQLSMMLTENMLYVANGSSALKDIALSGSPHDKLSPAVAAKLGKAFSAQVEAGGFGTLMLYPAQLAQDLQEVAQWLFNTLSATQGVSAFRLGQEILKLMEAYEVLGVTSSLNDESAESQFILKKLPQSGDAQE